MGASLTRREDPELLRGEAKFIGDCHLPGMAHVAILHSNHAHARITVDTSAASKLPGVVRIFTGADLAGKMMPMVCIWKPADVESHFPPHPYGLPGSQTALATDKVRYVGEWIAAVVHPSVGAVEEYERRRRVHTLAGPRMVEAFEEPAMVQLRVLGH
jgi:carbon-monoxide dehydrogenase large subunit